MEIQLLGAVLKVPRPDLAARYLETCLSVQAFPTAAGFTLPCPGCNVILESVKAPAPLQTGPEGYYTGLCHLAFRSADLQKTIWHCEAAGIPLVGGSRISYNPLVWGAGMTYINPECDFGFGMEFCTRLDLSDTPSECALEHIGIPTPKLPESIAWYQSLGFSIGTSATIHRESDGAVIHNAMMEGYGTILELYEFAGMDHEPFVDQPFACLRFAFSGEETEKALMGLGAEAAGSGTLVLTAPGGEKLEFVKGMNAS